MALSPTVMYAYLNGGETFAAGSVTETPGVQHITASQTSPLTNGTGTGNAQHVVEFQLNVNTSGTTIDLTALTASFGLDQASRNFSSIKGIIIENVDTTNSITIQPGAANGWTGINGATSGNPLTRTPGGWWASFDPSTMGTIDGTHKTVLIAAVAATANVKITFVGVGS